MSKGKKVKLAFHVVVANCCRNLAMNSIILNAATYLAIRSMSHKNTFEPPSLTVVGL
jgi:hypothetical protein